MSNEVAARSAGTIAVPDEVAERFPALSPDSEIHELLAENLNEGETLGLGSLTRVGNPSGKSLSFTVPDIETGKDRPVESIEGIIIAWQDGRSYFESSEVSDSPPDCSSRDSVNGFGAYEKGSEENPSGLCEDCPMGQWVETPKGEDNVPPPCKPHVNVLMLTDEEAFPFLVRVPRTSMGNFRNYRRNLLKKMKPVAGVTTKITLERAKSNGGTEYAEMHFTMGEQFDKATKAAALAFGTEMKTLLNALPPGALERGGEANSGGGVSIDGEVVETAQPVAEDFEPSADDLDELAAAEAETSAQAAS